MARQGNAQAELVASEGVDKYTGTGVTIAVSDESLYGPVYAFYPTEDTVITEMLDKEGNEVVMAFIDNAETLAAGELPYFTHVDVYSITFTGGIQVFYKKKLKV